MTKPLYFRNDIEDPVTQTLFEEYNKSNIHKTRIDDPKTLCRSMNVMRAWAMVEMEGGCDEIE